MRVFIGILGISLALVSCKTVMPTKEVVHTETKEVYRDTTVYLPGSAVSVTLDSGVLATIKQRLNSGEQSVGYTDPATKTRLQISQDKNGSLVINCETLDQRISLLLRELQVLKTKESRVALPSFSVYKGVAIAVGVGFVVGLALSVILRTKI